MTPYERALAATEEHLRALQLGGNRYVNIRAETLFALQQPVPERAVAVEAAGSRILEPTVESLASFPQPSPPPAGGGEGVGGTETASRRLPQTAEEPVASFPQPSPPPLGRGEGVGVAVKLAPLAGGNDGGVLPNAATSREEAMAELRARALVCVKCPHLVASRKQVVFGVGDIYARLMFVGEAPGADEDAQGEPFVGAAGQLLTRIIKAMGLSRETVYIANILKCRPDTPGQSYGNRKPTAEEMKTCLPWLEEQIALIRPEIMVALGATAVDGLLRKAEPIGRLRGHFQTFQGIPVMPTFHPSYLLRNQAASEKRKVWEDMMQVMERLGMTISEKQRGYFL